MNFKKDINSKLRIGLIAEGVTIFALILLLIFINVSNDKAEDQTNHNNDNTQVENNEEEKSLLLDIPSLENKDAFEILDLLIDKYGEPNPKGLVEVLKEFRDTNEPTFETLTWENIKYGYNFTFNFWTDGSLAREDCFYFIGRKSQGHSIEEILKLTNLTADDANYIFNKIDLGGAVFNVGITPKMATEIELPAEKDDELSKEEVLEILKENADRKWRNDSARAKLEYDNQVQAYEWILEQKEDPDLIGIEKQKYPDILEKAKEEWGHDYIMVKWQYEKDVKEYQATL